jgi:signal transduction histidine kinase
MSSGRSAVSLQKARGETMRFFPAVRPRSGREPDIVPGAMRISRTLDTLAWREPSSWWFVLCLVLIAIIATADYITGFELSLSILYLAPIFIATWIHGRDAGLMVSLIAAAAWLVSMAFTQHGYSHPFYHYWDAAIQFVTFAIFALLIARLKLALAHADERFVTVLEGLDSAVYVTDAAGELLYANQKFREELAGSGSHVPAPFTRDGEVHDPAQERWYRVRSRAIRWVDGTRVTLRTATDITSRKQAEELDRQHQEKLHATARLISVGEMASTLAHELNQPLAAIANYVHGCVRRLRAGAGEPAELLAALEKSAAQAERAGAIIQRVRKLVQEREPVLAPCDLNELVARGAALLETEAGLHGIEIRIEAAPSLPPVEADAIMIEQVLLNLLKNAIEAMHETVPEERRLTVRTAPAGPERIEISVTDRGQGIDEQLEQKLAAPLFTTKPLGMGLGLHICRSIIEMHGGHLSFTRNPGGGSTFSFSLAVAQP